MKSILCPILSLVVCSVLLFGSTESASRNSTISPSPHSVLNNKTISMMTTMSSAKFMSTAHINTSVNFTSVHSRPSVSVNHSSIFTVNHSSIFTVNHSSIFTVNHSSIFTNISNTVNVSIHQSTLHMNLTSAVIMSTAHGNGSSHNSTIHPTLSPSPSMSLNHSIFTNISSTVSQNASHMSSHIIPTHSISPSAMTSMLPTTTVAPPTTPPPTPPPLPKGKFSVKNGNVSCLLLWMSLEFTVKYKNSSGKEIMTKVVMPKSGISSGSCRGDSSSIRIHWPFYSVEATFQTAKISNGASDWITASINITAQTFNNTDFINPKVAQIQQSVNTQSQLKWLSGKVDMSLNCSQSKIVKFDSITATFSGVKIQPFKVKNNDFSEAKYCGTVPTKAPHKKKKNNNTVAIAVGCSLGGLVLIVLIGYFIGKRRNRSGTGYRKL